MNDTIVLALTAFGAGLLLGVLLLFGAAYLDMVEEREGRGR